MRLFYPEILRGPADGEGVDGGGGTDAGGEAPPADEAAGGEAPPADDQAPPVDDAGQGETAPDQAPEEYSPNFAYKVHDEEKEFPDWLKASVTDAETESAARELLERAEGLDLVKASRDQAVQGRQQVEQQFQTQTQQIQMLARHVQSGDFQSFFEGLQIPEDQVLRYALHRIQYRNATPEQRQAYDAQRDTTLRLAAIEAENASLRAGVETNASTRLSQELDIAVARPEVLPAASAYDARVGRPGAFRDLVIERGILAWNAKKQTISSDEAVKQALAIVGTQAQPAGGQGQGASGAGGPGQAPRVVKPGQRRTPPVLPNFRGSGASPLQQVPKSIKDLRKLAQAAT